MAAATIVSTQTREADQSSRLSKNGPIIYAVTAVNTNTIDLNVGTDNERGVIDWAVNDMDVAVMLSLDTATGIFTVTSGEAVAFNLLLWLES